MSREDAGREFSLPITPPQPHGSGIHTGACSRSGVSVSRSRSEPSAATFPTSTCSRSSSPETTSHRPSGD